MADLVGETLANRYQILDKLGEGGMGTVYRAHDLARECMVAVKVLHALPSDDPMAFERFRREAESLGRLQHPHIVRFYELVDETDTPFLVTDYVEGQNIAQMIKARDREPLPLPEAIQIAHQVGAALHYAHRQRIYHRDIKPSNVLLDRGGNAYLGDFGLALLPDRTRMTRDRTTESSTGPGTPLYMAPEQWLGQETDARTDIYALGALLYELLTGRPPFRSEAPGGLAYQHIHELPVPPRQRNPNIPIEVEGIILKALAKPKDERYIDVALMLGDLRAASEPKDEVLIPPLESPHRQDRRRLPLALGIGVGLVSLAILAGIMLFGPGRPLFQGQPTATVVEDTAARVVPVLKSPTPTNTATPVPPTSTTEPTQTPTATQVSTATPTPSPTLTSTPTSTPTTAPSATPSPTPSPIPYLTVGGDQEIVYSGPGENYRTLGQLRQGDRLIILGRSEDGLWWQVNYLGWPGWVSVQSTKTDADVQGLAVIEAPPTPVNHSPSIQEIDPLPVTVEAWEAVTVTCRAVDADQDELTYAWIATDGTITGQGETITYNAPEIVGRQTITVTVKDEQGSQAERAIPVQVMPAQPSPGTSEPAGIFGQVWHEHPEVRRKLGWAVGQENVTFGAQQVFERGSMFWRDDTDAVYGLTQDGHWREYNGTWTEGMAEYSCPDVAESKTPPTPKRGFGEIWCLQMGGPDAAIGWALADEEGYYPHWHAFERGFRWGGHDAMIYVFYSDQTWQDYPHP